MNVFEGFLSDFNYMLLSTDLPCRFRFISCYPHITVMAVYIVNYIDSGYQEDIQKGWRIPLIAPTSNCG